MSEDVENRRESRTTTTRDKLSVLTQELGREFIHWTWQINCLAKNRLWKERLHLRDNGKVSNLGYDAVLFGYSDPLASTPNRYKRKRNKESLYKKTS